MEQIRLENEQIEVTVNIHGAELRSLKSKADGQEYLWNADAKYWGRTSPVLFPFVGGVKNKVYRHEGKEYPMNQHGFARDMDFTLISRSTDEAWLALEDTDETRKVYPFHFHLEIGYRLEGTAVRVMWKVKNTNEKNMYFAIGAHPAFFCPVREGEKQSEYFLKFKDGEGNAPESLTNTVFGEGGVVTTQKKEYKQLQGKEPEEQPERFQAVHQRRRQWLCRLFCYCFSDETAMGTHVREPVLSESESCMECQYPMSVGQVRPGKSP